MKKHLFYAYPNPHIQYGDDLTIVVTTPKRYWEVQGCAYDQHADADVNKLLDGYDFYEHCESEFIGHMSVEKIVALLLQHPDFEFDSRFNNFIKMCS